MDSGLDSLSCCLLENTKNCTQSNTSKSYFAYLIHQTMSILFTKKWMGYVGLGTWVMFGFSRLSMFSNTKKSVGRSSKCPSKYS